MITYRNCEFHTNNYKHQGKKTKLRWIPSDDEETARMIEGKRVHTLEYPVNKYEGNLRRIRERRKGKSRKVQILSYCSILHPPV